MNQLIIYSQLRQKWKGDALSVLDQPKQSIMGESPLDGMKWLVFPKDTRITTEEPSMGFREGSEIMNSSLAINFEVAGADLGGSS